MTVAADKNAPIVMRRLALYYVAHLVGDMPQPLHAGRTADRGGVDVQVAYGGATTNLLFFGTETWSSWKTVPTRKSPAGSLQISRKTIV
jgi:hypothetical protein